MSTTEIREILHRCIDLANDKNVKAIYTIVKEEIGDKMPEAMTDASKKREFLDYLLSWPVMTDEELKDVEEKRKHLNKWK